MAEHEYVTSAEYNEHNKTIEAELKLLAAEDARQNERVSKLELVVGEVKELTISVNTLATNMQHMLEEQQSQGKRIESLELRDGEMWRTIMKCILTGVVTLVVGFVFGKIFN